MFLELNLLVLWFMKKLTKYDSFAHLKRAEQVSNSMPSNRKKVDAELKRFFSQLRQSKPSGGFPKQ